MADFKKLTETMLVSPQVMPADLEEAKTHGVSLIINNRPDGESHDQPDGAVIEAAARKLGMNYVAIPVGQAALSEPQVAAMSEALAGASGTALAYCRSGTRSTWLWSLAQVKAGMSPDDACAAALAAGYDVSRLRPTMEMFASWAE